MNITTKVLIKELEETKIVHHAAVIKESVGKEIDVVLEYNENMDFTIANTFRALDEQFGDAANALKNLCEYDLIKEAIVESVDKLVITNAEEFDDQRIELTEGVLTIYAFISEGRNSIVPYNDIKNHLMDKL